MYALYARMEKPLYVTSLVEPAKEILVAAYGSCAEGIYRKRQAANENDTYWGTSADIKKLQAFGYDGIIWGTEKSSTREYMVFDPAQIKSATDNIGTFDPEKPDIRYQLRDGDTISSREALANVLESTAQNDRERELLAQYKSIIKELDEDEAKLAKHKGIIRDLSFQKGGLTAQEKEELEKAKNRAQIVQNRLNRKDKRNIRQFKGWMAVKYSQTAFFDSQKKDFNKYLYGIFNLIILVH